MIRVSAWVKVRARCKDLQGLKVPPTSLRTVTAHGQGGSLSFRVRNRLIVMLRIRPLIRVRVRVRRGEITSHSIFYSRVVQIAIFSHCQPLDWEAT